MRTSGGSPNSRHGMETRNCNNLTRTNSVTVTRSNFVTVTRHHSQLKFDVGLRAKVNLMACDGPKDHFWTGAEFLDESECILNKETMIMAQANQIRGYSDCVH